MLLIYILISLNNALLDMFSFLERIVLACMVLHSSVVPYVTSVLTNCDFYCYSNSIIYVAITSLYTCATIIDFPSLLNYFVSRRISINYSYILSLFYLKCCATSIKYYVTVLLRRSLLVKLRLDICMLADILSATDILNEGYLVAKLQGAISLISSQASKPVNCFANIRAFLRGLLLTTTDIGFTTGFDALDAIIPRIRPGDLVIVAGRPSTGKTTFCLDILRYNALVKHCNVCILSLEMTANQLLIKLVSALTHLTSEVILACNTDNTCFLKVLTACNLLARSSIYINDLSQIALADIYLYLKNLKLALGGTILVVIDYVQLISTATIIATDNSSCTNISSTLKQIAKELGLAIIIISQLNRRVEYRQDKVPLLSDLRDSGTLEQDADLILFLSPIDSVQVGAYVRVFVSKNRNGRTGVVTLKFLKEYNCFFAQ
ncbi:AAA family ATPase [Candidatus Vidania fulgoroideae]|uniref:DNA 5'-3' helicase n=1 Tax=Candidatus Vidania fulgoroideorum TaxID=881286 RepID=A0A974X9Z9_9PROT|nr:AAA family ATPase [Candidatus Vidania fulgoroideae]